MSQEDGNNSPEMTEKIEIFSTDDEKIKSFGELLTNDSSRSILQILFKEEMTANEIAQKTGVSLQLVKYHINKMQDMGIIKVSKIEKNSKAQDMKFYTATKFAIVILPNSVSEKAKESKSLLRSFKILYKFAGVGIATVAAFFGTHSIQNFTIVDDLRQDTGSISLDRTVSEESGFQSGEQVEPEAEFTLEDSSAPTPEPEPEPTHGGVEEFDGDEYLAESGRESLDESLELAQRKIDAAEANPAAGSGTGILGPENFWPIIIAITVLAAGLALVFYWQAYRHPKNLQINTSKLNLFGLVFLAFTFALKYFR
jgi:DNA-binding transcriptional ArsR family regulator